MSARARAVPFRNKPNDHWNNIRDSLHECTFYVLSRCPTVFSIRNEDGDVFKLILGNPHKCSCGEAGEAEICVHFLFVMLKVLRVPDNNHLCWQTCFTDSEINNLLDVNSNSKEKRKPERPKPKREDVTKVDEVSEHFVVRQPLDDEIENPCPICQDNMTKEQPLTWCRKGCGNNIHARCMKM